MKLQLLTGFLGLLFLLLGAEGEAQLISTRDPLGVQAQIMLNLDQLEGTWEVRSARKIQAQKGSAPGAQSEHSIPGDMQLSLQLKAIQGKMDFELYPRVRDFVNLFARKKRARTEAMMGLSALYFPELEHELATRRMPKNLKFLPAALSALNDQAIAESGATGLWQMPFQVAIRYGLVCNAAIDERRDWQKSTQAALAYLNHLHAQYKDWTLAVTAFTCGAAGVQRARNRAGENARFEQLYPFLPEYSRDFVPAYMAVAYVMTYHQVLGLEQLPIPEPVRPEWVQVSRALALAPIAKVLHLPEAQLRDLNPVCRNATIAEKGIPQQLCLPAGYSSEFARQKGAIFALQDKRTASTPVLASPETKLPTPKSPAKPVAIKPIPVPVAATIPPNSIAIKYQIQPGDNLGAISTRYAIKLDQLKAWNGLIDDNIRADDFLTIHVPKSQAHRFRNLNGKA
ncbi:MAG TPA: LysM peptidoglycan-binding domain-containing protein, partial [Bacteroidetes bacterium]|nr:LysM peptidoglycan-binding domain-containing protein [Bacteroidota bacterium]